MAELSGANPLMLATRAEEPVPNLLIKSRVAPLLLRRRGPDRRASMLGAPVAAELGLRRSL